MAHEASLEDLRGFMRDDEREWFDSRDRTENERKEFLAQLQSEWQSIPDPTLDDLKPPYIPPGDWAAYENGSKHVIPFYVRQWKKQRRADAIIRREQEKAAEPEQQKDSDLSLSLGDTLQKPKNIPLEVADDAGGAMREAVGELPKRKGIEVSELEKQYEKETASETTKDNSVFSAIEDTAKRVSESLPRITLRDPLAEWQEQEDRLKQRLHSESLSTPPPRILQSSDIEEAVERGIRRAREQEIESTPSSPSNEVREDGYTDAQVAEYFEKKYNPLPDQSTVHSRTESTSESLSPRYLNRFRWFRYARSHPLVRKVSGSAGVVSAFYIFSKGLDYEINGAWKTAAALFVAAWAVLGFAIYLSIMWDKRRVFTTIGWALAGVFLLVIWWGYLPPLPQPTPSGAKGGSIVDKRYRRVTEAQRNEMVALLSDLDAGSNTIRIRYNGYDHEAVQLVRDFEDVFTTVKWHFVLERVDSSQELEYPLGLTIAVRWNDPAVPTQARVLADALQKTGFELTLVTTRRLTREEDIVFIIGANEE